MMSAELEHPGGGGVGLAEQGDLIVIEAGRIVRAGIGNLLVGGHDGHDLLIPQRTQHDSQQAVGTFSFRRGQLSHPQAGARDVVDGKVRPDRIAVFLARCHRTIAMRTTGTARRAPAGAETTVGTGLRLGIAIGVEPHVSTWMIRTAGSAGTAEPAGQATEADGDRGLPFGKGKSHATAPA